MAGKPKRQKVEIDLKKYSTPVAHSDDSMGVQLPNDVPVRLRCFRLLEEFQDKTDRRPVSGLTGWTVVLDAYLMGVKIYLRVGRDGTLKLFTEDEDGREKLVEWET